MPGFFGNREMAPRPGGGMRPGVVSDTAGGGGASTGVMTPQQASLSMAGNRFFRWADDPYYQRLLRMLEEERMRRSLGMGRSAGAGRAGAHSHPGMDSALALLGMVGRGGIGGGSMGASSGGGGGY